MNKIMKNPAAEPQGIFSDRNYLLFIFVPIHPCLKKAGYSWHFQIKNILLFILLIFNSLTLFSCGRVGGERSKISVFWGNYVHNGNRFYSIAAEGNIIWVGTDNGIIKYDSTGYKKYNIADGLLNNYVYSIAVDLQGVKWFGTYGGVSRFDGEKWENYTSLDGLLGTNVYALAVDKNNNIWCGTEKGLNKFDGKTWTTYKIKDGLSYSEVLCIIVDSKNNIWIGTGGRINKFDGNEWTVYSIYNSKISSNIILSIAEDKNGNIWAGTLNGLNKFDGKLWNEYYSDSLSDKQIYAIQFDVNDNLWIGTRGGINQFNNGEWINYNINDGLTNNKINSMLIDKDNNIWVLTPEGLSILKITDKKSIYIQNMDTQHPSKDINNINHLIKDDSGIYWIGTDEGLLKKEGNTWKLINKNNGLADNKVNKIVSSQGKIWCGTDNGLSFFDGISWTTYDTASKLSNNQINALIFDTASRLWAGTSRGLNVLISNEWKQYTTQNGLPSDFITALACRNNEIWVGTPAGLSKFDGNNWVTYISSNGLPDNYIQALYIDSSDKLWVGTRNGAARQETTGWTIYNTSKKLINNSVLSFYSSSETTFIGTWNGITYFDSGISFFNGKKINQIYPDSNNTMWYGTSSGLISKLSDKNLTYLWIKEISSGAINTITYDFYGNIWAGLNDGLALYKNNKWQRINDLEGIKVNKIVFDTTILPWLATNSGVYKLRNDSTWIQYDTTFGLMSNNVNEIKFFYDSLWIGTDKGFSKFIDIENKIIYNEPMSLPVFSLVYNQTANEIWCGTGKGTSVLTSSGWQNYDTGAGNVYDILADPDFSNIKLATAKGISEFYNSSGIWQYKTNYTKWENIPVYKLAISPDQHLWACTAQGLGEYYDTGWTVYDTTSGLPSPNLTTLSINSKNVKLIGSDKGIVKWDSTDWQILLPEDMLK